MKSLFSLEQYSKIFPRLKQKLSKSSQFRKKLDEWRKLRLFYKNLSKKTLKASFTKCANPSQRPLSFFTFLESRLDVVLYRAHFFDSILSAKQEIRVGRILVNTKKVTLPGYNVVAGDIISVSSPDNEISYFKKKKKLLDIEKQTKKESFKCSVKSGASRLSPLPTMLSFPSLQKKEESAKLLKKKEHQSFPFLFSLSIEMFKKVVSVTCSSLDQKISNISGDKLKAKIIGDNFISRISKISFKEFKEAESKILWCLQDDLKESKAFALEAPKEDIKSGDAVVQLLPSPLAFGESVAIKHPRGKKGVANNWKEDCFLLTRNEKKTEISNWLFFNFVLLLKKHHLISYFTKIGCFALPKKSNFLTALPPLIKASEIPGTTNKEMLFKKKKLIDQKNKQFFKGQAFFKAKRIKPLHLEISYRSRSIIFLFPPQRVCFPNFIDILQIYK